MIGCIPANATRDPLTAPTITPAASAIAMAAHTP
jgi:hypothetical protein